MIKIFALIGILTVIFVAVLALIIATESLEERVKEAKRQHTIKHRFDKPPTAKCYCRDCVHWDACSSNCYEHHTERGFGMADNWFCCFAEPIESERFEKREEIIKDTKKSQG